ncbi:hypothetical protein [Alicyclobacillus sp. SO9]|uniref:hypothetical protein n=1 Tax=Alicyclobacillus sp. SO9 TaxID=2665646 RepID=UPI0018E76768|nr:hypothetical protein [Alicyclobacillus sp. SO9]QQE80654.1 hypothetical protein GI364_09785 [Alicyclobacillus sp. SO9]
MSYIEAVTAELKKSWWNAIVVVVFTICRLVFGWDWFKAGWDKMVKEGWLTDGKFNSGGLIKGMVNSIQHSHGPDPLHLNNLLVWFANHIFLNLGGFVDFMVVFFEMAIGVLIFFGFGVVWALVAAIFLNLQYAAAGAANNFGYLVTDIVWLQFPRYVSLIGFDGYLRYTKGKELLGRTTLGSGNGNSGKTSAM